MADITAEELVERRKSIKAALSQWQQKAAVAQADTERIMGEISEALAELKDEFGCASYEDAVKKRDKMLKEIEAKCDELQEGIDALRSV